MSDILIRGMEMPTGGRILIVFPSGRVLEVSADETQKIFKEAQAIPIPPHGRCIDANALARFLLNKYWDNPWVSSTVLDRFVSEIANAPTIIPAEEVRHDE